MFDHVSLQVSDFAKSFAFYRAALAPLGFVAQAVDEAGKSAGFGRPGTVALWIAEGASRGTTHVAFTARDRAAVRAFHDAGRSTGGRDHGEPGLRPDYAQDYYAAFLLDPDGNNVEAVVHEAQRPVYYIGTYDIDDPETFAGYPPRVMALLPRYGGEVLASSTTGYAVEGTPTRMNAIIRFPSREAALGLYHDPDYPKELRQRSTSRIAMVLVDALG